MKPMGRPRGLGTKTSSSLRGGGGDCDSGLEGSGTDCLDAREVVRVRVESCCLIGRNAERVSQRRQMIDGLKSARRKDADIRGCNIVMRCSNCDQMELC